MAHLSLKSSILVDLPPCTLVFFPSNSRFLIVGTYQLEKETGLRRGSLDVFDTVDGNL